MKAHPNTAAPALPFTNGANVLSGALTFQEVLSGPPRKGAEYSFRKDLFCVDVNDKININLSSFRKDVMREIRHTGEVPTIDQFWANWLHEMSNALRAIEGTFRNILEIDGDQPAGTAPMPVPTKETMQEITGA